MDVYRTEEEQLEALRGWWKENGQSAVLGVVIGLAAVFGWRAWQSHELNRGEAASALYQELAIAVRNSETDKADKTAADLQRRFSDTPYAIFAALIHARLAVDAGDPGAAAGHLRTALAKNRDPVLKREIRLRLARVLESQDMHDEAFALLDGAPGAYEADYGELRGDIEAARGRIEAARAAYENALKQTRASGSATDVLEVKLAVLGPKPPA
ncbi:MAG: tetratricopeptide repeat protein [Gammaproteobacteria bacterium]|nr:tetratricopeptide repeat protein [Gammaproteobacteria bacterium]